MQICVYNVWYVDCVCFTWLSMSSYRLITGDWLLQLIDKITL